MASIVTVFLPWRSIKKCAMLDVLMEQNNNKKRILYVITKSYFGGAQRYVFELATTMQAEGHKVAVVCGKEGELTDRLKSINIKTYSIDALQRDVSLMKEIKAVINLIKIIREYNPEIIHLNSAKAGGLGSLVARLMFIPRIVFTAHGWSFMEPRKKWWKLLAWLGSYLTSIFSHHVITVSDFDRNNTKMPFVQKKYTTIHTAVPDFPLLSREEARKALFSDDIIELHRSNIWLLTIAELNNNKNQATAIDAVAEYNSTHRNKIFYSIIGSGETLDTLKEQVELRGVSDYVYFADYVKEARNYLLAFDIFLLPSKKEGLPYSLLEAGLAELPCIASDVGGISEVIKNKETGLLTDPNNHMTIVEALDYLLSNPDKRVLYSENLYHHIKDDFSLEKMITKTKGVYGLI